MMYLYTRNAYDSPIYHNTEEYCISINKMHYITSDKKPKVFK